MAWFLKLTKGGAPTSQSEPFEHARDALRVGNDALRSDAADDVVIISRERADIYYQFNSLRSASEEVGIARLLELEVEILSAATPSRQLVHIALQSAENPDRTISSALCGAPAFNLALVDPPWAERATCPICLRTLSEAKARDPQPSR